jgi:hypothetical protein
MRSALAQADHDANKSTRILLTASRSNREVDLTRLGYDVFRYSSYRPIETFPAHRKGFAASTRNRIAKLSQKYLAPLPEYNGAADALAALPASSFAVAYEIA